MEIFAQYGLAGIMAGIVWYLLRWMMKLHDTVMTNSSVEREKWQKVIQELSDQIRAHSDVSRSFHEQMLEKGRQERLEHERILKQTETCGFKVRHD